MRTRTPGESENDVTEEDEIMEQYGISCQTNTTFHFAGHKYQRLEDAVNYAKKQQHLLTEEHKDPERKS